MLQLKAEHFHTFEAYKTTMHTAAKAIGKDTPFCLYNEVKLPDAKKHLHTLKPFLVVGPFNMVAPLVKALQGGNTFFCSGTCSIHEGKISLHPAGNKVIRYKQIESQATLFKDIFGKSILIPDGAGQEKDEETAPVTSAAALAEPPVNAKHPTLNLAAEEAKQPPQAPPKPAAHAAEPHPVRLAKASAAWHGTRTIVDGKCQELKQAIRDHYGKSHPGVLKEIDRNMHKLDAIVSRLDHRLADSLQKASNAKLEAARTAELVIARGILNEYIKYVKSEPLIRHIDKNPFGVTCNLEHVLAAALTDMSKSLTA